MNVEQTLNIALTANGSTEVIAAKAGHTIRVWAFAISGDLATTITFYNDDLVMFVPLHAGNNFFTRQMGAGDRPVFETTKSGTSLTVSNNTVGLVGSIFVQYAYIKE